MLNRRTFLKTGLTTGAAAIPLTSALHALDPASSFSADESAAAAVRESAAKLVTLPAHIASVDSSTRPWQQRIRRVGQSNMTEHDPAVMNVEEWADYWHSTQAEIVFVSVTGILAFYPSKVKFHRHGKYLNGRDFFGECVTAAKKRGMRVVARMSPDLNWGDALEAHPEWAMRHRDGSVQFNDEEPRLFQTCMFSTYMDDYVPAIMREINSLYDVDCFYTNGWPPIGSLPDCHCGIAANFRRRALRRIGVLSMIASSRCGNATTLSPKRRSGTVSSSRTWAETFVAARISIVSARLPSGSRPIIRAAPTTTQRCGDARCRAASAMPCWTGSLPPMSLLDIRLVSSAGAMPQRIQPRPRCGSTRRLPAGWLRTITLSAPKLVLARIAAGRRWAKIIFAGLRNTMHTLQLAAPLPTSES